MEGWFLNVPIGEILYENIAQWTAFAFFGKELHELQKNENKDNEDIIRIIETDYVKMKFASGYNEGILYNFDYYSF
jgi:hypothetical protein